MERELFAVCAPGLESIMQAELRALAAKALEPEPGGVAFRGDSGLLYRANLELRTASRVLVRLGEFHARDFEQLRKRAARLAFESALAPGAAVRITAWRDAGVVDGDHQPVRKRRRRRQPRQRRSHRQMTIQKLSWLVSSAAAAAA